MARKKINPNRVPISEDSFDIQKITKETSNQMVLQSWALVLGALADFSETTTDMLLQLWNDVNKYSSSIHRYEDIAEELKTIERIAEISFPFERISASNIKTMGDLIKFTKRVEQNALFSGFALISYPIIHGKLLCERDIARVFRKAYSMYDEISLGKQGRLSLEDLLEMLRDEFSLVLSYNNGCVSLKRIEQDSDYYKA